MPQPLRLTVNPQRVYIETSNTDQTLIFDDILGADDFMGTILIDNISASVRFNSDGAVDANYSSPYTTTDKCLFDAKRGKPFHYYGASGTYFNVYISTQ